MKKIIAIFIIGILFVGCSSNQPQEKDFESLSSSIVDNILTSAETIQSYNGPEIINTLHFHVNDIVIEQEESFVTYSTINGKEIYASFDGFKDYQQNKEENYALLYKIKPDSTLDEYQISMGNNSVWLDMFIRNQKDFEFGININGEFFHPNNKADETHNFSYVDDEWINILISLDNQYNYHYLMWQETDPSNYAYMKYDLNDGLDEAKKTELDILQFEHGFFTKQDKPLFSLASIDIFKHDGIKEIYTVMNQNIVDNENKKAITAQPKQKQTIFTTQEIQPIEENPFMLPEKIVRLSDLESLSTNRPTMNQDTTADHVVNAMLGSTKKIGTLKGEELRDNLLVESNSSDISIIDNYTRISFSGNDGAWAHISVPQLSDYAFGKWNKGVNSNSAMLIKHRRTNGVGFGTFAYKPPQININAEVDYWYGSIKLNMWDETINLSTEKDISIQMGQNEWFYTLIAMDEDLSYRYITWQADNPQNYATYAYDLSKVLDSDEYFNSDVEAYLDFFYNQGDKKNIDLEFLSLYEFENFADIEISEENRIEDRRAGIEYEYKNKDEKYQLAINFFNDKDYYNAYLLLSELDGYSTSGSNLAESERLLSTIEIKNPYVSESIKDSLKQQGIFVENFLYIYQAEQAESLDLTNCVIEDLSFINYFPNLKYLVLDDNPISDLTPLKDLYTLESLSVVNNSISDTMPLYNLTNLKTLNLSNNFLREVDGLANLQSLKKLDLSLNELETLDGLSNLHNLEEADVHFNYLMSLDGLSNSPVKELNILNTEIDDLSAVSSLHELETLYAGYDYKILDLEYLSGGKYINKYNWDEMFEDMNPHQRDVSGLEHLLSLPNLSYLYITGLKDDENIDKIGNLTNLKGLCLFDNDSDGFATLSDATYLTNLKNLESLAINNFYVEDFTTLSQLTNLKYLTMENTLTHSLEGVSNLENLEYFNSTGSSEGEFNRDNYDKSLFDGMNNLIYASVKAYSNRDGQFVDYSFGDKSDIDQSKIQSKFEFDIIQNDNYTIDMKEHVEKLSYHEVKQGLTIGIRINDAHNEDGFVEINVPKNVKNLNIFSHASQPVRIKLDITDKTSLEKVVVGTFLDETGFDRSLSGTKKIYLENLGAFSGCENLREIYANNANITDISGLADCPKLEIVQLNDNYIRDISALENKIYLYQLELDGSPVKNKEVLESCISLH